MKTKGARKPVGRPRGGGSQRVYQRLRDDILTLRRAPGDALDESGVEKDLEVSRTLVREALIRLAAEGLVEIAPNRGARVAPMSLDALPELFESMDLCQRAVFRWAARRRPDALIDRLRSENARFERAAAAQEAGEMGDANLRFHHLIGEACGNRYVFASYAEQLQLSLRLARMMFFQATRAAETPDAYFQRVVREHDEMIDALEARDADALEQLSIEHMRLFRDRVIGFLNRSRADEVAISGAFDAGEDFFKS